MAKKNEEQPPNYQSPQSKSDIITDAPQPQEVITDDINTTEYDATCNSDGPTLTRLTAVKPDNYYYVSPVHSNESDIDDSEADQNFKGFSSNTSCSSSSDSESANENDVVIETRPTVSSVVIDTETKKGKKTRKLEKQTHGVFEEFRKSLSVYVQITKIYL